jgi:signal transduction histidine kinase
MVFSRFRVQIAVRLVLLTVTILTAVLLALRGGYLFTPGVLGFFTLIQVYLLYRYVEGTERDLARFFESISHDAFDLNFPSHRSQSSRRLHNAFVRIVDDFRTVRAQREAHYQYLQTVIHHVGIGLLAFDDEGNVDLCNFAALHTLGMESLQHLKQLEPLKQGIMTTLLGLGPGERKAIQIHGTEGHAVLAVHATQFRRYGKAFTLVSLQNISQELEEREMEAWQSILRAMTHEIRNSMTPIASLASTTLQMLDSPQRLVNDASLADDARLALRTIQRRSQSLLRFVDAFRTLAHIPVPAKRKIVVKELIDHLQFFFQVQMAERGIQAEYQVVPEDISLFADPALLEQVLINLVLNAVEALEHREDGRIQVIVQRDERGRVKLSVSDNGPGIPEEIKDKAFIPFYSTKTTGSGIGLSLSRLILRLHGATIQLYSEPNVRTVFEIVFPAAG